MSRISRRDVKSILSGCCKKPSVRTLYIYAPGNSVRGLITAPKGHGGVLAATGKSLTSSWCRIEVRAISTINSTPSPGSESTDRDDGAPKSPMGIVFTDIVKSTAIWETDTTAMVRAMELHDGLVRKLTEAHQGYEVKQNGDGFMIVFQSAVSALKFCLNVQEQMQDLDWPDELLEMSPARLVTEGGNKDDKVLWRGLRLRMSAHYGSPVSVWNDVIGRWDFLGPPVNLTARYISVCEGGQIVVSEELLEELSPEEVTTADKNGPLFNGILKFKTQRIEEVVGEQFHIAVLGERGFKGVSEKQKLYIILPRSLSGRAKFFPQHKYIEASKGNLTQS